MNLSEEEVECREYKLEKGPIIELESELTSSEPGGKLARLVYVKWEITTKK